MDNCCAPFCLPFFYYAFGHECVCIRIYTGVAVFDVTMFFRGEAPKAVGLSIPCVSWYVTAACFRRCRKVGRVARARTGCNRQRKLGTGSASLSVFANGGASARALRGGDHARDHATNAGSRSRRSNETQGPLLVSSRLVRAQVRPK